MTNRHPSHPIDPQFVQRWSPRAFDASPMPQDHLLTIFEAARWAPSSFNRQPWRLLYAHHGDANWARFLDLLIPSNQLWAQNASVLLYILSDVMTDYGKGPIVSHTHSFCTGAAWMSMALQAEKLGYRAHGMAGVDWDRVRKELKVPDDFRIEAAIAFGKQAPLETLPEKLQAREFASGRKEVEEFAFSGDFRP